MIYKENAEKYLKTNIIPIPLNGKIPIDDGWQETSENIAYDNIIKKPAKNIGILCGEPSGIVGVDIDVDGEIYNKIVKQLPYTKAKRGKKGATFFFKYNGEQSFTVKGIVDFLSTGRQTVMPPSLHPETKLPYVWLQAEEMSWDDLPDCPNLDFLYKYAKKDDRTTGGRNNALKDIACAMFDRGESFDDIVKELLIVDKDNEPPLFEDPEEYRRFKEPIQKAYYFAGNIQKTLLQNGWIPNISSPITIIENSDMYDKYEKLIPLRGVADEIFKMVYLTSPIRRASLSFASTLSIMSTVLGNKVSYQGVYTNMFLMMLIKSGRGKNVPMKFPYKLFNELGYEHLIGDGNPVGDTSIITGLDYQRTRLDCVDEADRLFGSMKNGGMHHSKMESTYAELYSAAGSFYSGKRIKKQGKNEVEYIGRCDSPCVSVLAGMTPSAFESSITTSMFERGMAARFLYFVDSRKKRKTRGFKPKYQVTKEVKGFIDMWRVADNATDIIQMNPSTIDLNIDSKAEEMLYEFENDISSKEFLRGREHFEPLINRLTENVIKMAIIDTCSTNAKSINPMIHSDNVKWAIDNGIRIFKNAEKFIHTHTHENKKESDMLKIFRIIDDSGIAGITRSNLLRRSRMLSDELTRIVKTLGMSEQIYSAKREKTEYLYSHNFVNSGGKVI